MVAKGRRGPARKGGGYAAFRTGLTYRAVYQLLWSSSENPRDWRYKRRGTVLGLWHQLKEEMWREKERREDEPRSHPARARLG